MNDLLQRAYRWHRPLMGCAAVMIGTGLVSAVAYPLDGRMLAGVPIWAKPLKFSISFGVYAASLAWLISRLHRPRVRRLAARAGTWLAGAVVLEMAAIVMQAARGRKSHFNVATAFDSAVYNAMGVLVVVIFVATVVVAVAMLREAPLVDRAAVSAVRLGLALSVAGMAVGFLMVLPAAGQGPGSPVRGAHSVGVADGGPSLPLLGWDTTGGDLRVPHFVGLHALQILPLVAAALTLSRAARRLSDGQRRHLVLAAAAGYAGLFALTLWQALRGQSVTEPDGWTVAALIALVAALGAAATVIVARPGARTPVTAAA